MHCRPRYCLGSIPFSIQESLIPRKRWVLGGNCRRTGTSVLAIGLCSSRSATAQLVQSINSSTIFWEDNTPVLITSCSRDT